MLTTRVGSLAWHACLRAAPVDERWGVFVAIDFLVFPVYMYLQLESTDCRLYIGSARQQKKEKRPKEKEKETKNSEFG